MRSIFLCESADSVKRVFAPETVGFLREKAGLCDRVYHKEAVLTSPEAFHDVDYIFSTWGMSVLTEESSPYAVSRMVRPSVT